MFLISGVRPIPNRPNLMPPSSTIAVRLTFLCAITSFMLAQFAKSRLALSQVNWDSSIRAFSVRSDRVIAKPSPCLSSVTFALVSSVPSVKPSRASAKLSAMVKQLACAAAINSSGLVPGSSPKRVLNPYFWSLRTPDWVET